MWFRLAVIFLLCALLFVGIVLVNAVDRMYFSSRQLEKKIGKLELQFQAGNFATSVGAAQKPAVGGFANAEFYDPARESGGRYTLVFGSDVSDLNPLTSSEADVTELYALCQSRLAARNFVDPTKFEPELAESWRVSEDHLTYRIRLRKGILWHDFTDPVTQQRHENVEVTARDFEFFFQVLNDPEVNCAALRGYYKDVKAFRIIDDYEFEVEWSQPYFRSLEITLALAPLPRHFYLPGPEPFDGKKFNLDFERNRMIVGTGPYRFESWERDARIILKRNEKYIGRRFGAFPALEEIVFDIMKLENTRFQALCSGQIDWTRLTAEQWARRTDSPQFVATLNQEDAAFDASGLAPGVHNPLLRVRSSGAMYTYIAYNQQKELFQDRRVRQALTMLVNRERILQDILFGLGQVISGPFQPTSPFYDQTLSPWPFDPEQAKRLLAEAGWRDTDGDGVLDKNGVPFEFTMMQTANSATQEKMLPIIKEDLAAAGIRMRIDIYEWSVFLQRVGQRNFDACSLAWTIPFEADPYQVWHSSQADLPESSNFISFRNAEADRLIEAIRLEFVPERRMELCHQFQRLLHEEQPYTFLMVPANLSGLSARFNNVRLFPLEVAPTSLLWVQE